MSSSGEPSTNVFIFTASPVSYSFFWSSIRWLRDRTSRHSEPVRKNRIEWTNVLIFCKRVRLRAVLLCRAPVSISPCGPRQSNGAVFQGIRRRQGKSQWATTLRLHGGLHIGHSIHEITCFSSQHQDVASRTDRIVPRRVPHHGRKAFAVRPRTTPES